MNTVEKRKGGRPPQGPKSGKGATFTTRITAATRDALADEAERTGRSVSQVAEIWLDEARNGRAQYHQLLGGTPELAAGIEKLVEIARAVDHLFPEKDLAHFALRAAWGAALGAVVPRPSLTADGLKEAEADYRQTLEAWEACQAVLNAIEHAGEDDKVFRRAREPLRSSGGVLADTIVAENLASLLVYNSRNAFTVGVPPGPQVSEALKQLRAAGDTAKSEIATAIALVRACEKRSEQQGAAFNKAAAFGRYIALDLTKDAE